MRYSRSSFNIENIGKGIALAAIVSVGLLGIVGSGGGSGPDTEPGTLRFSALSYSGNEDDGDITVTVTRTDGFAGAATVEVSDAGSGTATSGDDYTAISTTTLSWADGDATAKTITVSAIADGAVEADETVNLALGNASGATLGSTTSTTVTILNDDTASSPGSLQFVLSGSPVPENIGTVTISVTRTGGDTGAVSVNYATSDGTATAGNDYTATSGTLSWADGISGVQSFTVAIIDDTDVESDETVNLTLSSPTGGASLGTSTGIITITSDDAYGTLQFSATSFNVNETDGTVSNVITLQRVNGSSGAVSVDVTDLGTGSATGSGTDYSLTSPTTVSWSDGDTADKNVTITLVDDALSEGTETVNLSLGNVAGGASIGTPSVVSLFIADDEASPGPGALQFDLSGYGVAEAGGSATITVNRVSGTQGAVSIGYATSNGTATAGSDYTSASGTLSWADGDGSAKTFTVAITNDTAVEGDETVNLTLSSPTGGASLGTPSTATLTIDDDDTNLTMNIGDGSYWVAFQDGVAGTWNQWSPTSGNTYDFPVTDSGGRYGVAFHRQETDGTFTVQKTYVIHATVGELASLNAFPNTPYTVSGTLSGYTGSNDSAVVAMHTREDGAEPLTLPYPYTLARIPAGTRDLLASEWNFTTGVLGNFVLQRDITISGDLSGQDMDFGTDGESPTITERNFFGGGGIPGQGISQALEVYYATANGTAVELASDIYGGSTPVVYPYFTNSSMTQAGDSYSFQVYGLTNTQGKFRIRNTSATSDPGDRSMGLGNFAQFVVAGANSTQTWGLIYTPDPTSFGGSPVFRGFQIDLDQTIWGRDGGAHWQIKISKGWLGTSTSYTHPLLSSIAGFDAGWGMVGGTSTMFNISAITTNSATGLDRIIEKTLGLNSANVFSSVIEKKLAQKDTLKADIAYDYFYMPW